MWVVVISSVLCSVASLSECAAPSVRFPKFSEIFVTGISYLARISENVAHVYWSLTVRCLSATGS